MKETAKKVTRFAVIGLPKRLIGWDQIKANKRLIADLWRSARTPVDTTAHAAQVLERFAQLRPIERQQLVAGHARVSRFWWGCAAACLAGALYMVANQAPAMVAVHWLAFAVLTGTFGLKRVYRAWQVETGTLFQPGAFRHFFQNERWFR
ncbi:hypothetical protein V2H26_22195 [Xanthomonas euvesicatoria]|uniref:hypothetical protein n=1 Tax=Xanthomonas citri TaxID=346 RepID=UPI002ED76A7D|nr:hypothetical protein [Xanthomonas euvesicatoria]